MRSSATKRAKRLRSKTPETGASGSGLEQAVEAISCRRLHRDEPVRSVVGDGFCRAGPVGEVQAFNLLQGEARRGRWPGDNNRIRQRPTNRQQRRARHLNRLDRPKAAYDRESSSTHQTGIRLADGAAKGEDATCARASTTVDAVP